MTSGDDEATQPLTSKFTVANAKKALNLLADAAIKHTQALEEFITMRENDNSGDDETCPCNIIDKLERRKGPDAIQTATNFTKREHFIILSK